MAPVCDKCLYIDEALLSHPRTERMMNQLESMGRGDWEEELARFIACSISMAYPDEVDQIGAVSACLNKVRKTIKRD